MILRSIITLACCLAAILPAHAQEKVAEHPIKPLLWKVTGGDLKEESWLFGTIHIGRKPVAGLHPVAAKALKDCDIFYSEVDLDPNKQMGMMMKMIRKDGTTLTESIGEAMTNELAAELHAINPQLKTDMLDPLKTWVSVATIPVIEDQIAGLVALDQQLWNQAKADGKELDELETIEFQLNIFDELEEKDQITLLSEMLKDRRKDRIAGRDPLGDMVKAYASGDPKQVDKVLNEELKKMLEGEHRELALRLKKKLIDDRNTSMTETIHKKLKKQPEKVHFIAVGAGHLVGAGNICDQLRDKGYTVTLHQD